MEKVEKSICQFLDNTIVTLSKASIYRIFTAFLPLFTNKGRVTILFSKS